MREETNILKFINNHKQMRVSYIIYSDFEAPNEPVDNIISDSIRQISKQVP